MSRQASSSNSKSSQRHPVDQVPKAPKLAILGFQHVLAFYAGAVIVPLVIAQGLGLDQQTTIHLINADLFTCGIATLIQSVGFWKVGVRLPIIQGVTFTAVSPIIAIGLGASGGTQGSAGLPYIYGSIIVAGLFTFFAAPYFARMIKYFPPVVIGTVLTAMGITLLAVSAGDFTAYAQGSPKLRDLAYAFGTLAMIVLIQRFFKGFMGTISVLLGLVIGTGAAFAFGHASFTAVNQSAWIGVTTPFYFGWPKFALAGCISMIIVMLITMVETTGDVFAAGEIVGKRIGKKDVAAALRADGLSTTLGGVLNSFPYTCFAQNVGLVRLTQVKSRWVVATAGVFMIILGLLPKAGAIVAAIPAPVLGGASVAMFANVALVGIQMLSKVDLHDTRNASIVTTSIGLALLVSFKPDIAKAFPDWAQIFFASGVTLGSVVAITLNLAFFHIGRQSGQDVATSAKGEPISLEEVNAMDRETFVATFSSLFNKATWPLEAAYGRAPFRDVAELREAIQESVLAASKEEQIELVRSYPDMAELLLAGDEEAASISQDVGSLALDRMTDHEETQIRELANAYREKFGFPFISCLTTLQSREQIIKLGLRRLEHSPAQERMWALSEVVEIAEDRFGILLANANPVRHAWSRRFDQVD